MTAERARYILDNTVYGSFRYAFRRGCAGAGAVLHDDGITEAEDAHVREVWDRMPGDTCYHDAVVRIARGEA